MDTKDVRQRAPQLLAGARREIKHRTPQVLTDAKDAAYRVAARIEEQVQKRTGVIGGLADVVEDTVKKGKGLHEQVQEQGGYSAAIGRATQRTADALSAGKVKLEAVYQRFQDGVLTDGRYDPDKVKALLTNVGDATKQYGAKAIEALRGASKKGLDRLVQDYRLNVPKKKDRATLYAGIGTSYRGVLLRKNFEDCIAFHTQAAKVMPGQLKLKQTILKDIKAYAISSGPELRSHYIRQLETDDSVLAKMQAVRRYF